VVAEAVGFELVSASANSLLTGKITGNFIEFAKPNAILNANTRANSEACSEIPCATEQGIFSEEQGISCGNRELFNNKQA
jgi:hypothetical protein